MLKLLNSRTCISLNNPKFIHTTSVKLLDQEWRKKNKLPANPNYEGDLINLPDYTYMDGKTTPLGQRQKRRVINQRVMAAKIVEGISEIDYAIERQARNQQMSREKLAEFVENKLKEKGHLLLKKKSE